MTQEANKTKSKGILIITHVKRDVESSQKIHEEDTRKAAW